MARSLLFVAAVAGVLQACSSETPVDFDHGNTASVANISEHLVYPSAPYGTRPGGTIENFEFLGWARPDQVGQDVTKLEPMSLADYYNPDGSGATRVLVMTSTAVWCSACKLEYQDLVADKIADYRSRGAEFMGALFEDVNNQPAQPSDLKLWASTYSVSFPFVLDPELKLGAFFSREATPMEMVIDTKTMQILQITDGWLPGNDPLWSYLDQLLAN